MDPCSLLGDAATPAAIAENDGRPGMCSCASTSDS